MVELVMGWPMVVRFVLLEVVVLNGAVEGERSVHFLLSIRLVCSWVRSTTSPTAIEYPANRESTVCVIRRPGYANEIQPVLLVIRNFLFTAHQEVEKRNAGRKARAWSQQSRAAAAPLYQYRQPGSPIHSIHLNLDRAWNGRQ